jgi:hypothetical protein
MTIEEIKVELALALRAVAPGLRECTEAAKKKAEKKGLKRGTSPSQMLATRGK